LIQVLVHLKGVLVHPLDGLVRRFNGRLLLSVIDVDLLRRVKNPGRSIVKRRRRGIGAAAGQSRETIAAARHALLERRAVRKETVLAGLLITKIEIGFVDRIAAHLPVRPNEIVVGVRLSGLRGDCAEHHRGSDDDDPFHGVSNNRR
jgi:hypothetical protein